MKRVLNFGPGPAALPLAVLQSAQDEFLDIAGTGKSMLETSHRSREYAEIHEQTKSLLGELLGLGDDFSVLLLAGGASMQFVMVPFNLLGDGQTADYLITGSWAKKALAEARVVGKANVAADMARDGRFTRVPGQADCQFTDNAAYVHLTSNNTIVGTQYHEFPQTTATLVADMSSDFLSRRIDVRRFGLIYAGAQKNIGPSGVAVALVRKDVLSRCRTDIPVMLSYKTHADKESLYNTPPCFNIYLVGKVLGWIKEQGGLEAMEQRNQRKADLLYQTIDRFADFYRAPVEKSSRSLMNVVFRLPSEQLEQRFVAEAKQDDMVGLKGHRSVGGIRVSLYNGVEPAWVEALAQFMAEFVRRAG